jgi:valyl-tRNA synthetase
MYANWPKPFDGDFRDFYGLDDCYLQYVEDRNAFIVNGRNLRQQANIQASKRVPFVFKPAQDLPDNDLAVMKLLLNAETLDVKADYEPPKGTPVHIGDIGNLYLPLEGLIDVEAEKARLTKEIEKVQAEIDKVEAKLKNPAFLKAPANVIDEHKQRLVDWHNKLQQLKNAFEALAG